MSRVSIHIDESKPVHPVPILRVNDVELAMNDHELNDLLVVPRNGEHDRVPTARGIT